MYVLLGMVFGFTLTFTLIMGLTAAGGRTLYLPTWRQLLSFRLWKQFMRFLFRR